MALTLNKRDKKAVIIAGCAICLFILVEYIIFPLIDYKKNLGRKCLAHKKELERMVILKAEYDAMTKQADKGSSQVFNKDKNFNLFSYLDQLADTTGIKNNIGSMNPTYKEIADSPYKLSIVDMKLNDVNLEQLVKFIHGIEYSDMGINVDRISITKQRLQESSINAIIQVETTIPS